jgi:hypothetical protein
MDSSRSMRAKRAARILTAGVLLGFVLVLPHHAIQAAEGVTGHVVGEVLDHATKAPVEGATVVLPQYGAITTSGPGGAFAFDEPLPTDFPYRRIEATVTAPGRGRWTIRGVPLYPNDTLKLRAELRPDDWEHLVLTPTERRGGPLRTQSPGLAEGSTCTGWDYQLVPPETIKVFLSEEGASEEYDYYFYVTHVLPNEWIASWDEDALGAGAIAAKTYAAYRTMSGHAYSGGEGCADVIDTVADQVFDPTWSHERTDQAVYAAMGSILYRDGGLFLSQYWAGAPDDECAPVEEGQFAGRMSQWGTQTCALEGMYWTDIVTTFYQETTWKYRENLLLDSSVESAGTYPWAWDGTATRTKGHSHHGNWHWELVPPPGDKGWIRQRWPFLGTETTTYHAEAALRCETENRPDCTITMKVVIYEPNGQSHIKSLTFTEPDDGKWRLYSFDPTASPFVHEEVRLSISSSQIISVDAAVLWSAYGSP